MAAPSYNPEIYRGITFSRTLLVKRNGDAFDLSGCSIASQVRTSANTAQLSASFTCMIDENPATGLFTLEMSKTDSAKLTPGQYTFDIVLTLANGQNKIIAQGTITVLPTNTRAS